MKVKTFRKKLAFQKQTVANLNGGDMKNVQAGIAEAPGITVVTGAPCVSATCWTCACTVNYTCTQTVGCPTYSGPPRACCL